MEQWINGQKPKGVVDEHLLVLGPEDFDDEAHFRIVLDEYTLRMESVVVLVPGNGTCGAFRPKGFTYQGVCSYAYEWAIKNFWPVHLHDPAWWGGWWGSARNPAIDSPIAKKARIKRDAAMLSRLLTAGKEHAHCIVFWDRECKITTGLMESAREVVPMSNFKVVRI